jgi:hydrogenase maturation protein HypF
MTLARCVVDQACYFREVLGAGRVGLTGGVFQNRVLTEAACEGLAAQGFEVVLPTRVPCNDGGLSFGQVVEFAAPDAGS